MRYSDATDFFEKQKQVNNIPRNAVLDFLEKRIVETGQPGPDSGPKEFSDVLAWVCRFYEESEMRFYELTATMDGKIIRYDHSMQ